MLRIFYRRMIGLGRGDEGVALVVTLGIFMFLYVTCASVYAFGWAVKEKLQLQAACDAAAYSAAVVQADTFSRIATINRTMGWTYAQMTKRQADYIMWKWLDDVQRLYRADAEVAMAPGNGSGGRHGHIHGYIGADPAPDGVTALTAFALGNKDLVKLNNRTLAHVEKGANSIIAKQGDFLGPHLSLLSPSFYADNLPQPGNISRLRRQLSKDRQNIDRMNRSLSALLGDLPQRIRNAVTGTLHANVPAYMRDQCCVAVSDCANPKGTYMTDMTDEGVLVGWAGASLGNLPSWLPSNGGICRSYAQNVGGSLVAEWHWATYAWTCPPLKTCFANRIFLRDRSYTGARARSSDRASDGLTGTYFDGVAARPLKIDRAYFGPAGTITITLARRSANPFAPVLGNQSTGIYSAFNPLAGAWTFCLASAKAGYKLNDDQPGWEIRHNGKAVDFRDSRDYCVDWKEPRWLRQRWVRPRYDRNGALVEKGHWEHAWDTWRQGWNLIQSDWDAVMVPVRQGGGKAREIQHFDSVREWRANVAQYPFNFEPYWDNAGRDRSFIARDAVYGADWLALGNGPALTPSANGLLGQGVNWNAIGDEMYH